MKFVLSRVQNGHPIALLDMRQTISFDGHPNLEALSEVNDLQVLYTCSIETEIYEYLWINADAEECIDMI